MPLTKKKKNLFRKISTIRQERREAGESVLQMRALLTGDKRDFNEQEQAEWVKRNAAYDKLDGEYQIAKRSAKIAATQEDEDESRIGRDDFLPQELRHLSKKGQRSQAEVIVQNSEDQTTAIGAWMRNAQGMGVTRQQREACERINFNFRKKSLTFNLARGDDFKRLQSPYQTSHISIASRNARQAAMEHRGFGATNPGAGGVFTQTTFVQNVELAMLDFSGVLQVAEVITTSGGGEFRWPTGNDTSNTGRRLNAAVAATTDTTTPFAAKSWFDFKYSSDLIKVEQELLEDAFVDIPAIVAQMLGERLGRITNTDMTGGDGGTGPEGLVIGTSVGKTTASSTAFTAKELIDLQASVDPAYWVGSAWMMHSNILAEIRKLQDSNGRFHLNLIEGLKEGMPTSLLGYPIYMNQAMDSTLATTKKVMLFGQLSKYKVRRVNSIRLYRLQERYRDTDEEGFVAFIRQDGKLLNAGGNPVKRMVMV